MKKVAFPRRSLNKTQKQTSNTTRNLDDIPSNATGKSSPSTVSSDSSTSFSKEVAADLQRRKELRIIDNGEDVTPELIEAPESCEKAFEELLARINEYLKTTVEMFVSTEPSTTKRRTLGAMNVSLDDIVNRISEALPLLNEKPTKSKPKPSNNEADDVGLREKAQKMSPFIKIHLRQTEDILLFEQHSTTVPVGTEEAERVKQENEAYEYVTKGKGRLRRKADSEAQTTNVLYKSREANTDTIKKINAASYVSNFDMFDTYQQLKPVKSSLQMDDTKTIDVMTYKLGGEDPCDQIGCLPQFEIAQMVTQRILAGNVFKEQQRRFRNMYMPDPLSIEVKYLYRTEALWTMCPKFKEKERHAVSCMSWCPSNGDILAVGYGIYTCSPNFSTKRGYVCIWSIKNPVNPEKSFEYTSSVVSVEFSPFKPQLLAIGLYDGRVEVRDITRSREYTVAISQRETSPGYQPVLDIKWIPLDAGESDHIEPFLTVSQDGSVMKYRVLNSPYLLGYTHAVLNRVEGSPQGLAIERLTLSFVPAVRECQCLGITLDPVAEDIFYVISNEGVIYKCSTNYPQQYLSVMQAHDGPAYSMEFSPWSPKLFLTCGGDWCIRIWLDGIFEPLITLSDQLSPINCAYWSKTHSTIIVAVNRKTVDIWDIRRNTYKPMSSTRLEKSYNTLTKFSNCGRSMAVGNERGATHVCALEDMPFPPHFQYEELEKALLKELMPFPDLLKQVKNLGYFGYPKKNDESD